MAQSTTKPSSRFVMDLSEVNMYSMGPGGPGYRSAILIDWKLRLKCTPGYAYRSDVYSVWKSLAARNLRVTRFAAFCRGYLERATVQSPGFGGILIGRCLPAKNSRCCSRARRRRRRCFVLVVLGSDTGQPRGKTAKLGGWFSYRVPSRTLI